MSDLFRDLLQLGRKIVEASEALQVELDRRSPVASPRRPTTVTAESTSAADESPAGSNVPQTISTWYARHVLNGCCDPLDLLTVEEAEQMMGCRVEASTTGEEEYIGVHYGCADERSMYVSLNVSATMPWDFVVHEGNAESGPKNVGEEALMSGDVLYVRQGEAFFWIYGRGIDQTTIHRIARHVAAKMASR